MFGYGIGVTSFGGSLMLVSVGGRRASGSCI